MLKADTLVKPLLNFLENVSKSIVRKGTERYLCKTCHSASMWTFLEYEMATHCLRARHLISSSKDLSDHVLDEYLKLLKTTSMLESMSAHKILKKEIVNAICTLEDIIRERKEKDKSTKSGNVLSNLELNDICVSLGNLSIDVELCNPVKGDTSGSVGASVKSLSHISENEYSLLKFEENSLRSIKRVGNKYDCIVCPQMVLRKFTPREMLNHVLGRGHIILCAEKKTLELLCEYLHLLKSLVKQTTLTRKAGNAIFRLQSLIQLQNVKLTSQLLVVHQDSKHSNYTVFLDLGAGVGTVEISGCVFVLEELFLLEESFISMKKGSKKDVRLRYVCSLCSYECLHHYDMCCHVLSQKKHLSKLWCERHSAFQMEQKVKRLEFLLNFNAFPNAIKKAIKRIQKLMRLRIPVEGETTDDALKEKLAEVEISETTGTGYKLVFSESSPKNCIQPYCTIPSQAAPVDQCGGKATNNKASTQVAKCDNIKARVTKELLLLESQFIYPVKNEKYCCLLCCSNKFSEPVGSLHILSADHLSAKWGQIHSLEELEYKLETFKSLSALNVFNSAFQLALSRISHLMTVKKSKEESHKISSAPPNLENTAIVPLCKTADSQEIADNNNISIHESSSITLREQLIQIVGNVECSNFETKCAECGGEIEIFNNDLDFSYDLHLQDSRHSLAVSMPTVRNVLKVSETSISSMPVKKRAPKVSEIDTTVLPKIMEIISFNAEILKQDPMKGDFLNSHQKATGNKSQAVNYFCEKCHVRTSGKKTSCSCGTNLSFCYPCNRVMSTHDMKFHVKGKAHKASLKQAAL